MGVVQLIVGHEEHADLMVVTGEGRRIEGNTKLTHFSRAWHMVNNLVRRPDTYA